jgi:5-methylcytosine-specific restriction enzyme A
MFEVGRVYNRRTEIHDPYGGQWQGGISTPRDRPLVFLFTGESGEQYGYEDGWGDDGVFLYTGEGQVWDMEFRSGNRAIRDHTQDGKNLHLFRNLGKGKGYRYVGRFACSTWEYRKGLDANGEERYSIVFHLIQPAEGMQEVEPPAFPLADTDINVLRERAYGAASQAEKRDTREAKRLYRERSSAVRGYVLARANGSCEACGEAAPFQRPHGTPYLEPHHTRKISDEGPDHPRWVGAVCPNCHRELHHG